VRPSSRRAATSLSVKPRRRKELPLSLQAALLGVVQGVAEFLPVSSSAHLILARMFFGFDGDKFGLSFDVACHVGTLIAVLIYFRRDLARMVAALPRLFDLEDPDARLIWLLAVATLPAIVVGLLFKHQIEDHMRTPQIAAETLAIGGILLALAERAGSQTRSDASLTWAEALLIGAAQALALVPGVSRSGATITVALFIGLRRADAARFIFLLAIPAILGAAASEAPKLLKAGLGDTASLFAIGIISSAIVGYVAVKYFIRYLANHSLDVFAWYRLALAATVAVWIWRS
jgi:undecaprenyl-diphosphatase